jgi:hypothetical protein
MNTMNKILAILGITTAIFIIVCFAFVWHNKVIPDSLIYSYFAAIGGEGFVMGWIKNTKEKNGGGKNE